MSRLFLLATSLQELARISYAYRTLILITSVGVVLAFAWILLSSKEARELAGSWVTYVGWAFLAYGFQYFFRLVGWLMRNADAPAAFYFRATANFLANFGSGANNLFFLAAALILLNKRTPFLRHWIFITITTTTAALTTVANFYFVELKYPLVATLTRLPDALVSASCLGLFGYATMKNFLTHQRRYWAIGVVVIGIIYAFIQLVYAMNPLNAHWKAVEIQGALNVLNKVISNQTPITAVDYLDSSLFALALPLKMLLFVPAFYLFFTLIISAHDFRKVLRVVREQKKSYFSSDGIVWAIGESVSAESVEVLIKLPGTEPPSAWSIAWPREKSAGYVVLDPQLNPSVDSRLLKVLDGDMIAIPVQESGEWQRQIYTSLPPQSTEPLMLPVKFHGAVIGCLKTKFGGVRKLNYATFQQLNSMADMLAPAVQDYRALASLDQLSDRFARLQVQKPGVELTQSTREMGSILHDVLSPLATGLLLEAGFRANYVLHGAGDFLRLLEGQTVCYKPEDLTTQVERTDTGEVKIYKNLLMTTPQDELRELPMGNVILILPSQRDKINRPTLGEYGLHRRAIASHTADAFLDLVRGHLQYELKVLSVKLNTDALSQEAWLKGIQEMARQVGLLWVGVTRTGDGDVCGDAFAEELIPRLDEETRRELCAKPLSCVVWHDETTQTHHVMRIELTHSQHQVWFGIAREGFGFELDFPSPWMAFLEDFKDIVDSALTSLFDIQKSKQTLARLAEDRIVMNIAITTGHLMHELSNKVDAQQLPAESLWRAVERGGIKLDANQRAQMKAIFKTATVMKELIAIFKNETKIDDRRIFSLREVTAHAFEFYEQLIAQNSLKLRNRVKDDCWIEMPFNVVLFAIANLVGNSKEAIEKRLKDEQDGYVGEIRVEARMEGDSVICHVIDNGPGIPEHIKAKLYQLGSSDKQGHNGLGLYFTKRALVEHGGEITLIESSRGLTKFSLKFPKAKSP